MIGDYGRSMAHSSSDAVRWRRSIGVLVIASVLGLPACGGDDDDAGSEPADVGAPARDGDDEAGAADDGNETAANGGDAEGGEGDGPTASDGFPIPAPDGLVLDALVDAGVDIGGQRQLLYENDDFDRVVAFYDDWTDGNGEWSRGESDGTVLFQDVGGVAIRTISITPDHDAGAQADGPVTIVVLVASDA